MLCKAALLSAALALGLATTAASSQVIYAPIQYQYDASGNGNYFYYGGSDPLVFQLAARTSIDPAFARVGGYAFAGPGPAALGVARLVERDRTPAYSDAYPYRDLSTYYYGETEARNAAYNNAPRYFRKADLLRSAVPQPDGSRVVPPTAPFPSAVALPSDFRTDATRPDLGLPKGAILIIPRTAPKKPAAQTTLTAAPAPSAPTALISR